MNRFVLASFLLVAIFAISEASVARQVVKAGEKVEVDSFKGAKAIKRTVDAGEQVFHLEGALKGQLVDAKGKKLESGNFEVKNGVLVIKKFSKADVGSYADNDGKPVVSGNSAVPAPVLLISLE